MERHSSNLDNPNPVLQMKYSMDAYLNHPVNHSYYETITVTGVGTIPELTEKEFKEGKAGIVWIDNNTGRLVFTDSPKPGEIQEPQK